MRSALRRLVALLLAVGLLPAASGGSVCLSHWGQVADAPDAVTTTGGTDDAHAHHGHAHGQPSAPDDQSPTGAPQTDAAPPCTALAACGVLVTVEPTRPLAASTAVPRAVAQRAHAIPPGPASAPDVPPPRA
jgi:hypothetical protein